MRRRTPRRLQTHPDYLDHFTWWRIVGWLRKRHLGLNWGTLSRRHLPGWEIRDGRVQMFRPRAVAVNRYRYRGTKIPTPWATPA
jgi:RNA-directed DNA polymerase